LLATDYGAPWQFEPAVLSAATRGSWVESESSRSDWESPEDVKRQFPKASVVANNRIVFNIAGGAYRLIVSFNYGHRAGYVKFFGTHADYDGVDAATVDQP
jgi:mRNA interferase HigB